MIQGRSKSCGMHGVSAFLSVHALRELAAEANVYWWNPPDAFTAIGLSSTRLSNGGIGGGGLEGGRSRSGVSVSESNAHKFA